MAITGTHAILYTSEPEAVRTILRDVLGWRHVNAGEGWLIFALPPAELGIHPAEAPADGGGARHQLALMCDDIGATMAELRTKGVELRGDPEDHGWGVATTLVLPGGLDVMLYEPRHPTAV